VCEQLLSGAIALSDQLGATTLSAEARVELGYCYYRQGLFDLARATLRSSLKDLTERGTELRGIALIRMASVERHVSRLHDALGLLNEAGRLIDWFTPWTKGRYHLEFATTLKNLAIADDRATYFDKALGHYREASTF
jgi:tetratricopeptide (TPR) repeat protein